MCCISLCGHKYIYNGLYWIDDGSHRRVLLIFVNFSLPSQGCTHGLAVRLLGEYWFYWACSNRSARWAFFVVWVPFFPCHFCRMGSLLILELVLQSFSIDGAIGSYFSIFQVVSCNDEYYVNLLYHPISQTKSNILSFPECSPSSVVIRCRVITASRIEYSRISVCVRVS